jgi:hypothetical protein
MFICFNQSVIYDEAKSAPVETDAGAIQTLAAKSPRASKFSPYGDTRHFDPE